jgi:protein-tyrosine kinase
LKGGYTVKLIDKIGGKLIPERGKKAPVRGVSSQKSIGRVAGAKAKAAWFSPVNRISDYTAWMIDKIRGKLTGDRWEKFPRPVPPRPKPIDPVMEDRVKAGWVSPVYSRSRFLQVDMNTALENRCVAMVPDMPEAEHYKLLRTRVLQKALERQGNTLMITSAHPGEGKTLTSINLALTFARHFNKTALLVDCDLRKPSVHRYLGLPGERGLVDYLLDGVNISDLIIWPGIEKFTVLAGGRAFPESGELLGSPRMKEVLADMKGRYRDRYVLFDVPPVLSAADALAFAPLVDHVIMVVYAGKTSLSDVKKSLELLPKEKILGVVLNRHEASTKPYYYPRYPGK